MNMNMNISMNMNSFYLYFGFFCLAIFIDYFIVNKYLGLSFKNWYICFRNSHYLYINFCLFVIFLAIFSFCFDLRLLDVNPDNDFIMSMADKDKAISTSIGTNSTVSVNNPKFGVTIGDRGINNIAAALSATGGATVGLKTAQYIGGTPATKLAVGLATMAVVQAGTSIMSKVLNNNYNNNNLTNKFIANYISNGNSNDNNILNNYPLNLISDIDLLLYGALLFLIVILNIKLANYVLRIDYNKYLPNNKLGKILNILINRYIGLWGKSYKYLLIFSYTMLFISIILSKICLYIITNYYS